MEVVAYPDKKIIITIIDHFTQQTIRVLKRNMETFRLQFYLSVDWLARNSWWLHEWPHNLEKNIYLLVVIQQTHR